MSKSCSNSNLTVAEKQEIDALDKTQRDTYRHLVASGRSHSDALRLAQGPDSELPWNKGRTMPGFGQTGDGRHMGWC